MKIKTTFLILSVVWSCNAKENQSIEGVWESIGHGQILEIKDDSTYSFYDITSISCLPSNKGRIEELTKSLNLQKDTLSLKQGEITYEFTRAVELPELCRMSLDEIKANDPLYNFEVFMETVKEHYAFLDLNNINWDDLYSGQRAKLSSHSTAIDLYLIIEDTFEQLNDNHAFIQASDDVYVELDKLPIEEDEVKEELPEYGDFPLADMVAEKFMQEDLTKGSWLIKWGKISKDIGYMQVKSMWLYADLNLSEALIDSLGFVDAFVATREDMYEGTYMEKEVEGVSIIMDRVMKDLAETKSIVIDVRFNGGGQDVVGLEILRHFVSNKIQVATHKFRFGDQHTSVLPVHIEGSEQPYTNPVYILTSPQSGSAAETFALATLSMPHVNRIGSATEGAISTTLDKTLPIGWDFCVSNEVFMDNMGKCYENQGVPVDYELNYSRDRQEFFRSIASDLNEDKLSVLKAIEELQGE